MKFTYLEKFLLDTIPNLTPKESYALYNLMNHLSAGELRVRNCIILWLKTENEVDIEVKKI